VVTYGEINSLKRLATQVPGVMLGTLQEVSSDYLSG